jgi:hypothetical protein
MAITHNQLNRLWVNPDYEKFKNHSFTRHIFTSKDAEDLLRTGAYLIKEAERKARIIIPWNESRRIEILANPRLSNAYLATGAEYFLKGVFLYKGLAINKPKKSAVGIKHPIPIKRNKGKLLPSDIQDLYYILAHIGDVIDFENFDLSQMKDKRRAKEELKGKRVKGIPSLTIPYPKASDILTYLRFIRNNALHRPFIMPEFRGITKQIYSLLDYISKQVTGKGIDDYSILSDDGLGELTRFDAETGKFTPDAQQPPPIYRKSSS